MKHFSENNCHNRTFDQSDIRVNCCIKEANIKQTKTLGYLFMQFTFKKFFVFLFFVFLPLASAQAQGGRIKGTVLIQTADKLQRIPNVKVILKSALLPNGAVETFSDEEGNYLFRDLIAGDYTIAVDLNSFEKRDLEAYEQKIGVPIGSLVDWNIVLKPKNLSADVDVAPDQDRINTTESNVASQISSNELRNVPLANEKFQDALPLLPGVVRAADGTLNIKGARANQSGVLVSSLNVTDPVTGVSAIDLPLEAVESLQVFSNPFSSEYGRFTGAVTTIETRSGTNEWKYLLTNWLARPRFREGKFYGIQSSTPRIAVGGPIKKDKLFFFQSFEYRFVRTEITSLPATNRDQKLESFDSFTRVDWNINAKNRLTVSFSLFPQKRDFFNLNTFNPSETTANFHQRGWFFAVNEQSAFNSGSFLQSSLSVKNFDADIFAGNEQPYSIAPQRNFGGWFNHQSRDSQRIEWLEIYNFKPLGKHSLKVGLNIAHTTFEGTDISKPVRIQRADGSVYQLIEFIGNGNLKRNNTESSVFVQDKWSVAKWLTLDLGLRFDRDSIGKENNFAPRFGFALLPFGNEKTVVRGGIGLFYDKIPLGIGVFNQYQSLRVTTFLPTGAPFDRTRLFINTIENNEYENPYSVAGNIQLDHEFTRRFLLRLGYEERRSRKDFILEPVFRGLNDSQLLLKNDGASRYREFQIMGRFRFQEKRNLYLAYIRSKAEGDLNDFNSYFGNTRNAVIRKNEFSIQPFDAPHRFLFWGDIGLPKGITFTPVVDWRSGFPFSFVNERQDFIGTRNTAGRFPRFFSFDLQVTKEWIIKVPNWKFIPQKFRGKKYPGRFGVKLFNITNHFNPRDVQNNIDAVDFGTLYNSPRRAFRLKFEFVKF